MYKLYKEINRSIFLLIIIWILFGHGSTYAQDNRTGVPGFSGMIIDQYGRPVSGAEISVKKTGFKTFSNKEGIFKIDPVSGNTVMVSHPSFMAKEIKLPKEALKKESTQESDTTIYRIRIAEKLFKNPETIDVVYGTTDKKSYLGSAATMYTNQMNTTLSSNIAASFAGRLPGLYTNQERGMRSSMVDDNFDVDIFVGNRPKLNIGGYGDNTEFGISSRTLSPVVVIDGVQRDFYSLDPENIESISIQKDALSSMSLGMRSSRPVLVITTKNPVDQGFQISFTGKFGIQKPMKMPKALSADQYVYLLNEALQNDGKEALYSYDDYMLYKNQTSPYTHPNTDWYDAVMKDHSTIQSYSLNATGGNKVAQYYVSLGYLEEDGLFRSSKTDNYETNFRYQRYLVTSKVNVNVTNDFKIDVSLMGRIEDGNQPGEKASTILSRLFETPNFAAPVYNPNGSYGGNLSWNNNLVSQTVNSGYVKDNRRDGMAAITMKYDFSKYVKGLSASMRGNITTQSISAIQRSKRGLVYQYYPSAIESDPGYYEYFGSLSTQSNDFKSVGNYQQMYGQIAVNYETSINKHNIGAGIFGDIREEILNYDLPKRPANLNANVKYNYDMKYFAEASLSRSYFNRYRPGKRWGTFFALGAGWDVSRENFLADVKWLDQFKIRAVYGNTGNGIDNAGYYDWRQAYGSGDGYVSSYPTGYNRTGVTGVGEIDNKLANWNLSWEKAHKISIGTDISLFNNRLQFSADYYRDKYYDLLQTRGKSIELIGLEYPNENIGKNLVTGAELSITYQDNIGDFNYFVSANWSRQKTEVLFMDEQDTKNEFNRRTGQPVGAWFGYVADGFFQSEEEIANSPVLANYDIKPGDIKYMDLDGNGIIDQFDQTVIGNDKPLSYFGLNLGFEYKGFEISALIQGVYNRDIYLDGAGGAYVQPFFTNQYTNGSYGQAYENALNRWTPETAETATFPRLKAGTFIGWGVNDYNTNPGLDRTSFWVKSGNYIRLKNVGVAYTLPDSFSRNYLGGVRIKIFVNGQNLLTKSSYEDLDPEVLNFTNSPNLRGFNTGVNIKF